MIQKAVPDLLLTADRVAELDLADRQFFEHLFQFIFCVHDTSPVGEDMLDKVVMERTLLKRVRLLGRPGETWVAQIWGRMENNELNWQEGGCFNIEPSPDGTPGHILKHCSGQSVPWPADIAVHDQLAFDDDHNDHKACVLVAGRRLPLREFFSANVGPNEVVLLNHKGKSMQTDAQLFKRQVLD
jgi:hypothetical protein